MCDENSELGRMLQYWPEWEQQQRAWSHQSRTIWSHGQKMRKKKRRCSLASHVQIPKRAFSRLLLSCKAEMWLRVLGADFCFCPVHAHSTFLHCHEKTFQEGKV